MKPTVTNLPAASSSSRDFDMQHRTNAFTLVELAIVLTIISLIVGGMFVGQSIIHSSRLQSVERDVNFYTDAMKMFQAKYKDLPGDFSTATAFWPSDGNGNGDGTIGISTGHPSTVQTANPCFSGNISIAQD